MPFCTVVTRPRVPVKKKLLTFLKKVFVKQKIPLGNLPNSASLISLPFRPNTPPLPFHSLDESNDFFHCNPLSINGATSSGNENSLLETDQTTNLLASKEPFLTNEFKAFDIIHSLPYLLVSDITAISIALYYLISGNVRDILGKPYWNYAVCSPAWKGFYFSSFQLFQHDNALALMSEDQCSLSNLLVEITCKFYLHKIFHNQLSSNRVMHFLETFRMNPTSTQCVPVLIVGITCLHDPDSKYNNTHSQTQIIFQNSTDNIFEFFNCLVKQIETESYYQLKMNPLTEKLEPYKGPRFQLSPITFTDTSPYRWEMIQLAHVFPNDDPILTNLTQISHTLESYLSNDLNDLTDVYLNLKNLVLESFDYYNPPKLEKYLKPFPWGDIMIVGMDWKTRDLILDPQYILDTDDGEICAICRSDYQEGEISLKLKCNHYFHSDCIGEWIKGSPLQKCPICRKRIAGLPLD